MPVSILILYVSKCMYGDECYLSRLEGFDTGTIKLFLLLYADDMTLFSETAEGLQEGLDVLEI